MNEHQIAPQDAGHDLEHGYAESLENYLLGRGEDALQKAYEIGRTAMAQGVGVLEMAAMHHAALANVLPRLGASASLPQTLERAKDFLAESLSPYEMAHRGFREAISALRRVNETLEQEIQRIAHAVHDEAGQLLVAARLAMSGMAQEVTPSVRERLQEVGTILDQVEKQLRRLSHELRPTILDDLGLVPAVRFLADGISKRTELSVRVESSLETRCPPNIETVLYRVVQEALTNITKHARAENVKIQLTQVARNLHCLIQDDGAGFDVSAVLSRKENRGLGLVGIRERLNAVGGTLQVQSQPGQGTGLLVKIPMEK